MRAMLICAAVAFALAGTAETSRTVFVEGGRPKLVSERGVPWGQEGGTLACSGPHNLLYAGRAVGNGDFRIHVALTLDAVAHTAASFAIDDRSHFGFDGANGKMFVQGPLFGNKTTYLDDTAGLLKAGTPFTLEVVRTGHDVAFTINGNTVHTIMFKGSRLGSIALRPWRSTMRIAEFWVDGNTEALPPPSTQPRGYTIPVIDVSAERERQVIVESIPGQYLGHPTTLLMPDNKTIFVTYPLGHGGPSAVLKKSTDGGLTWSGRLPVPENWKTARNCPCIHRLVGPDGVARLFVLEGNGAMRQSVSLDEGKAWTPFEPNGLHCVVAPITIEPISGGRHLMLYHRGFSERDRSPLTIWQSISPDGGLTWQDERQVAAFSGADPCEPAIIRSPDGKQLVAVMRENRRRYNSLLIVSNDEGETWSDPVELPASLTGDRHMPRYAHDGRLVMTFRDTTHESPTRGDFVGWVGTYDDMVNLREGQYRVRLLNSPTKMDLGYPGLELLPDGTFVTTTYAVLNEGEKNSVVSVRFSLKELDDKAARLPEQAPVFVRGKGGYHTYRIPAMIVSPKGTVLAFCEGRKSSGADHGDIDLLLKRSTDGGVSWMAPQIVWEDGDHTVGNPCPVVDQTTGTVWLGFCRDNDRVFMTHSNDDGATWARPAEITTEVKPADWGWYATGPVHGIQLKSGRLLMPCDHRIAGEKGMYSHAIYSDDHGTTWQLGGCLTRDTDECAAVETTDGRVYMNMRSYEGKNRRAVAWSDDGGLTWSDVTLDETLIEPICQGSALRYHVAGRDGKSRVLFSNPASTERVNMTVRVSYDECQTWSAGKTLNHGPSAYSDLAVAADGTILCLYERGKKGAYETITLARFGIDWLEK
jgi:BNR repeat-like domain